MLPRDRYEGREQTYVKHFILESYLEKLAYKVGSWCPVFNFVDCFAGPWRHEDAELKDTSPFIAIKKLHQVRNSLASHGKSPEFRCLFVEKNRQSWELLQEKVSREKEIECHALLGEFEDSVESIRQFCRKPRQKCFNFIFIDPTGWKGFALDTIQPLLLLERSEVLVNFMTQHIARFIDAKTGVDQEAFRRLFGSLDVKERWSLLSGTDREFEMVRAYGERVARAGNFEHVAPTIVLHPTDDRTHFHLIYATRHDEGLRTFRNDAERPAIERQREARWQAQERRELGRSGQTSLFHEPPPTTYLEVQQNKYRHNMLREVAHVLETRRRVLFEELEMMALRWPLIGSKDLREWIQGEKQKGRIRIEGLGPRERTPKPGRGHYIALN